MSARSDELIETLEDRATYLSEKARDTPSELNDRISALSAHVTRLEERLRRALDE